MKNNIVILKIFISICLFDFNYVIGQQSLKLQYKEPANNWVEALPLGNGRIGAMVYGHPLEEKIQLNEGTFWSGSPHNNLNDSASFYLDSIRHLQFQKKFKQAEVLCNKYMLSPKAEGMKYMPVGNLGLQISTYDNYTNYNRELDLNTAINTTTFSIKEIHFKREVFISYPNQVMVVRLTADKPSSISGTFYFETMEQGMLLGVDNNTIEMSMISPDHEGIKGGVKLNAYAKVVNEGGGITKVGSAIVANKADAITIYVSMRTNYKTYNDLSANPETALVDLQNASVKGFYQIKMEHIRDYQQYFNRSSLQLGNSNLNDMPIAERIKNYLHDTSLPVLLYQYGRYLLISGSRLNGQPLTLQGLWNDRLRPSWDSKYTININTEMNYWPAEITNLPEMQEPLFSMIKDLSITGADAANKMYHAKGWVAHHNTDLWRTTGVVDGAQWGMWTAGGAWLGLQIWQHYLFSGDTNFLQKNYLIIKGMSEFILDFLVTEPEHGYWVIAPSLSPENSPKCNKSARVNYGCTIDNQIVLDVFDATVKATKIIGIKETELIKKIAIAREHLVPLQIGKYGQLQEWMWDWDEKNEDQSHISHLYGFYPSNQISFYKTPVLTSAVRNSLTQRGDKNYTSWGRAWRINQWARLHDGEQALYFIQTLLRPAVTLENGGSLPNLFSSIGPIGSNVFQIEANLGLTAGIAEMLLQSHDGAIDILPALPKAWSEGKVTGLKARGGFEIDIEWAKSKLVKLVVRSKNGGICKLRMLDFLKLPTNLKILKSNKTIDSDYFGSAVIAPPLTNNECKMELINTPSTRIIEFNTIKGEVYTFN